MGLFSCCSKKQKVAKPGERPAEPIGTIGSIDSDADPSIYSSLSIKIPEPDVEPEGSVDSDDLMSPSDQPTPPPDDKTIISPVSPGYDDDGEESAVGVDIRGIMELETNNFSPASSGMEMAPPSVTRLSPAGHITPPPIGEEGG